MILFFINDDPFQFILFFIDQRIIFDPKLIRLLCKIITIRFV